MKLSIADNEGLFRKTLDLALNAKGEIHDQILALGRIHRIVDA